ncbi:MAG: hypothetical protein DWI57_14875 [Chloroflexi bacterium]|nr:MAG: hypothetical protein DWI57_14875 [Chloroflexota bacterium]
MWTQKNRLRAIGLLCTLLLFAACGGDEPETPVPAPLVESGQMTPVIPTATLTALPATPIPSPTTRPTPVLLPDILPAALYFLHDGQIQRLESDGVTLTQMTQEAEPITDFDVSPVDARLVYVSGNRLVEANPQYGTEIVKLDGGTYDENDPAAHVTQRISAPHFSPDGSQIAFGLNGINLIPAGDATEYTTILPSDPYPEPNNPPRSAIRFYSPGVWSPDGTKLLVNFGYWPEAGGIALLNVDSGTMTELASEDPNATLCCGWDWGRDGSNGYIASNLLIYAIPGLTKINSATGVATLLTIGLPPKGPSAQEPIRLFQSVFEDGDGSLLSFVSQPTDFGAEVPYLMQRISADGSQITPERPEEFMRVAEALWAANGSGAVLRTEAGEGEQLVWLPRGDGDALTLPGVGPQLRWAPVITQDNRQAAAEGERAIPAQTGGTPQANPAPEADAAQLIARSTLNLRSGPGTLYPVVGSLAADESVAIVGVSPDRTWWQVAVTAQSEATAWVIADPNLVETQNAADVAVVIPPPPPAPAGRIFHPGWNPDGQTAIFVQELIPGAVPQLVVSEATQPSLSADGTQLAVRSVRSDLLGIGSWNLTTKQMVGLTSHPEDTLPGWSPSGDAIVFASTRHGDRRWRVYVQPTVPNDPVREIAFGLDPNWHVSADLIAYKGCDISGENCGIWTMDSQGGQQTPATNNKSDSRPVWSPTGETIVFMSEERDGNWELYSVDAGVNVVTRLTNNPTNDGLPVVSPDGRQIAFVSNRGGEWGVWVMPLAGGSPERILRLGADLPNWLEQGIDWTR